MAELKGAKKKEIVDLFKKLIKEKGLGYRTIPARMPHRTTFARRVDDDLTLYLLIQWHSYRDKIALEVGWTFKKTLDDIRSDIDPERVIQSDAVVIGLAFIAKRAEQGWWDVRNYPAIPQDVPAIIAEAFSEFFEIGVPYLERVVQTKLAGDRKPR